MQTLAQLIAKHCICMVKQEGEFGEVGALLQCGTSENAREFVLLHPLFVPHLISIDFKILKSLLFEKEKEEKEEEKETTCFQLELEWQVKYRQLKHLLASVH